MLNKSAVVCIGQTSKKFFNGETERVDITPFVGQDNVGQFGIGLFVTRPNGTKQDWTWGLIRPRHLIQSWRAMKLIEEIPRVVLHGTLCHCWILANENIYGYNKKYLDEEGTVYGDYEKFREARAKVLAMFPTDDELKAMLAVVGEQELDVRVEEIEEQRKKLSSAEEILKRLIVVDDIRRKRDCLKADTHSKREAEGVRIPNPVAFPKLKSFFLKLLG